MTEKETTERKRVVKSTCTIILLLTFFGVSAHSQPRHPKHAAYKESLTVKLVDYHETGVASWYGRNHRGRLTYSGDRFDPQAMTCAHKTLPMQTIIRVTTYDGKSVTCRVNDRGPFVRGRIVDLSEHAARELGFADHGISVVTIEVVQIGDNARLIGGKWF